MNNRLKDIRIANNLNMKEFAKTLGVKYTTYVGYEKGQHEPLTEFLFKVADLYNVTIDYILCNDDVSSGTVDKTEEYLKRQLIINMVNQAKESDLDKLLSVVKALVGDNV